MHTNVQAVNYAVGKNPRSVAIADLDKDGYLDMVIANYDSNSISVLFGNPAGTFSPAPNSPYAVGVKPYSIAIEDLNKDGYLDIAVVNSNSNSVSVLFGNAARIFAPAPNSPYSVGASPRSVAIADLNNDGYLDIVTANHDSNSVSILIRSPGDAFYYSTNSPYSVGTNPASVAIADLNNDGYLDIVTANYGAQSVSILIGSPNGVFSKSPNLSYTVGNTPHSVVIADLNNDGYLDIVTANNWAHSISILIGNPGDAFFRYTNSSYSVGTNPHSVTIEDLNKDGYLDIITANLGDDSVSVLLGNPAGTFFPSSNSQYVVGEGPHSVATADLNKDGNADIVTTNTGSNSVSILFGTIDGPFSQSMGQAIAQEVDRAIKEQKQDQVEEKLNELQDIINNQKDHSILYPSIIAGATLVGTKLPTTLFKGGVIGLLIGTAACILDNYYGVADYVTKLIGDTEPEVHQQHAEKEL